MDQQLVQPHARVGSSQLSAHILANFAVLAAQLVKLQPQTVKAVLLLVPPITI